MAQDKREPTQRTQPKRGEPIEIPVPSDGICACFFAARGGCSGPLQRMHWIRQQVIRRELGNKRRFYGPADLDEVVWDERVWDFACDGHHDQFDFPGAARPRHLGLTRADVPESVEQYAEEHGLGWWLDREYGERERFTGLTAEEFERGYAERGGMTVEKLREFKAVRPCDCGEDDCRGWQSVPLWKAAEIDDPHTPWAR